MAILTVKRLGVPAFLMVLIWGGAHAFSAGHGKAIVAGYLIGSRSTARHAVFLALTVTLTHTSAVFVLGVVAYFALRNQVPWRVLPWIGTLSGLLIVGLRGRDAREPAAGAVERTRPGPRPWAGRPPSRSRSWPRSWPRAFAPAVRRGRQACHVAVVAGAGRLGRVGPLPGGAGLAAVDRLHQPAGAGHRPGRGLQPWAGGRPDDDRIAVREGRGAESPASRMAGGRCGSCRLPAPCSFWPSASG